MNLESKAIEQIEKLGKEIEYKFQGMSNRWEDLKPESVFNIRNLDEFHIGYIFGSIEDRFVTWFYIEYGRSMTDEEYREFWKASTKKIQSFEESKGKFYFQE
jgi:hypothetical protein